MGSIMLCYKYGRYLQKNPLLASVLLKRFKGSASTTDHTLARGNARPLQVENVSIDSLRSGTDDAKQNIKKLVRATSAELSSFPTDERLPNLCYPEHNFERSNEKRSIGQPTPDTHPHLMQPLEDLQSVIYRYKKVYKRAWRYKKEDEFENVFEDLMTMERFSMVLNRPQEPILLPALLKRHRILSKNKTYVTPGITKIEYEDRRKRLLSLLANTHAGQSFDKHAVIIMGYPTKIMSADIPFPFHQNSDFLYLSGFQEPDAVLILESQRNLPLPNHNMLLFVKPRDPKREIWDGPVSGLDAAVDFFGASEAFPISSLASVIHERYGNNTHCLWYNLGDNQTNPRIHSDLINMFNGKTFNYPALHSLGHNVQILRLIKSPAEIKLMKKTAEIGARAFSRVMLSSRPGLEESVLHAILEYECKLQGAQRLAFPPVVAGGLSANTLHYVSNAHVIRDGDMILMDAGCEYNGYVSDITRTWPVNGKFTEEQRQLYEIVLRVQAHCIEHCKVGVSLDQLHQRMISSLGSELQRKPFVETRADFVIQ